MFIDMYMSDDNKPIGWWLKEVDRLLELSFEQVLAADGLTRRQWQALNAAAGPESVATALATVGVLRRMAANLSPAEGGSAV